MILRSQSKEITEKTVHNGSEKVLEKVVKDILKTGIKKSNKLK